MGSDPVPNVFGKTGKSLSLTHKRLVVIVLNGVFSQSPSKCIVKWPLMQGAM